jgi:hypothetical protein
MLFFRNFPRTAYIFGNNETIGGQQVSYEIFQDISRYTDVIDQIADNVSFYQYYTVQENDRPDQTSFKIYGTPEYHWTFFLLNSHLRARGWPLTMRQLEEVVKRDFPHYTITTRDDLTGIFIPGQTASGSVSGARGEILRRYLDLGQVVIAADGSFDAGEVVRNVAQTADGSGGVIARSVSLEYLAAHHYEDVNGNWVDIDPRSGPGAQLTEITHYDRYVRKNNELKDIKIIKPQVLQQVVSAFFEAIKS